MFHFWSQMFFCLQVLKVCSFVFICLFLLLCAASFQNLIFRIQFFFHSFCVTLHNAAPCVAPYALSFLLRCYFSHVVVLLTLSLLACCYSSRVATLFELLLFVLFLSGCNLWTIPLTLLFLCCSFHIAPMALLLSCRSSHVAACIMLFTHYNFRVTPCMLLVACCPS